MPTVLWTHFPPAEAQVERRGIVKSQSRRPPGDHYTPGSYRRPIPYACLRGHAGKGKEHRDCYWWHPHKLRHNYATMIRQRVGVEEAQNMLDHFSANMTLVYAERDREQAVEIASQVGYRRVHPPR